MHPRSIELASVYNVPVYVAGTFSKKREHLSQKEMIWRTIKL